MKKGFVFGIVLLFCACGVKPLPLTWSAKTICTVDSLFTVDMSYPLAAGDGSVADSINTAVRTAICSATISDSDTTVRYASLGAWIDTLKQEKAADEYLRTIPYDLRARGRVYERGEVISLYLQTYTYMGGAHGMTFCRYLNFDRMTGARLTLNDLVSDTTTLAKLNRVAFSHFLRVNELAGDQITLFVEPDALPLPQEVGLDSAGLVMQYNHYEIAPYVFGTPTYTIPYADVDAILTKNVKK